MQRRLVEEGGGALAPLPPATPGLRLGAGGKPQDQLDADEAARPDSFWTRLFGPRGMG